MYTNRPKEGIMYFIIAVLVIIFYLLILDKLSRIANATEVTAQSLKSINKKINALQKQLVAEEVKAVADAEYEAKPQPKAKRVG